MVTMTMMGQIGNFEACAQHANSKGFVIVTNEVFQHLFPGMPVGAYQTFTYQGTTISVATVGGNVPPGSFAEG